MCKKCDNTKVLINEICCDDAEWNNSGTCTATTNNVSKCATHTTDTDDCTICVAGYQLFAGLDTNNA